MTFHAKDLQKGSLDTQVFRQKQLYETQLDICFSEIKRTHLMYPTLQCIIYNVPTNMIDEPYYNWNECIQFIKKHLVLSGFYCRIVKPGNRLFASWNPQDTGQLNVAQSDSRELVLELDPSDPQQLQSTLKKLMRMGKIKDV